MNTHHINLKTALAGAAVTILLSGCLPTVDDLEGTVEAIVDTATQTEAPATDEPENNASETAEPVEADDAIEPDPEPVWTTLATLSGNANKQSDTITLSGDRVRLTYDFVDSTGQDMIIAGIYLLDEGTDLQSDGGIPEVMISEAGEGETFLRKSAGEYYVYVMSANAEYTVSIEVQE